LSNLQKQGVRLRVIGRMSEIPEKTRAAFETCTRATEDNTGLTLVVALNYGGRQEILDATRSIASLATAGELAVGDIDEALFSGKLSTAGIPDPDLVVRTSGELRISNFLLWQIAYAELFVTDVLWPDFSRDDLLAAIVDFQSRERRYGGSQ
jgi:undecaprenyl diphosphate synthase